MFTITATSNEIKTNKNYISKIINNINNNCKYINKNECFKILSFLIKNKKYVDGLKINKINKKIFKHFNNKYKYNNISYY